MTSVSCNLNDNGGSPDTIVRQDAGSFITDGFEVGMGVRVSLAATAGNNNPQGPGYVITVRTADTLTFVTGTLDATDAADTITITAGAAYRSTVDNTIWLFDTQNIADDAVSGGIDLETVAFSQLLISFEATLDTGGTIKRRQTLVINGAALSQSNALYDSAIFIDTTGLGSSGTAFPIGTFTDPVDNITDARTIANSLNIRKYQIRGTILLGVSHTQWSFVGVSSALTDTVQLGGQDVTDSAFVNLTVSGAAAGSNPKNIAFDNIQMEAVTGFDGVAIDSGLKTSFGISVGGDVLFENVNVITTNCNIDGNGASTLKWAGATGLMQLTNFTAGSVVNIAFDVAFVVIGTTNTGGNLSIGGLALSIQDHGMNIVFNELINHSQLTLLPWNDIFATHIGGLLPGSTGEKLDSLGTSAETAADVWNAAVADHAAKNTFGWKVGKRLLDFARWIALRGEK